MAKFEECIDYVFKNEGDDKYTDRSDDKGGPTKFGITLATLTAYQKRPTTDTEVMGLTRDVAKSIAKTVFWKPLRLDDVIEKAVATAILDISFPEGIGTAAKFVQIAVGIPAKKIDGVLGSESVAEINKFTAGKFLSLFLPIVQDHFINNAVKVPAQLPNLAGWLHRSQRLVSLLA